MSDNAEKGIEVRRLDAREEYAQAVELQRVTWGAGFRDVVPAAILKVTQRVGGIAAGAFSAAGELVGFVYGLTGFYDDRLAHWSHMLAVRPEHRDHGIGRRLKEYQRGELSSAGIDWMYWSVDPLVARNAHLNLNRLRVDVRDYVPDMYGETGSGLHAFGTDRFVVACQTSAAAKAEPVANPAVRPHPNTPETSPVLNQLDDAALKCALDSPAARVEIPADIAALSLEEARNWRLATRRSFQAALGSGFRVTGFKREPDGRCFYSVTKVTEARA